MKIPVLLILVIFLASCKADDTRLHPACKDTQPKPCNYSAEYENENDDTSQQVYYDTAEKKCKTFTSDGCNWSRNVFDDAKECQDYCDKTPEEICSLPLKWKSEEGFVCLAKIYRYYYNASEKKCEEFQYGGCYGNQNNFYTKDECEKFCGNV